MDFIGEIIKICKEISKTNKQNEYKYNYQSQISNNSFKRKEYLITPTERKFYIVLKQIAIENNLIICPQVSLYEIIQTENIKDFNRISRKSIDFVITEPNMKIKCCIELDDYTHKYDYRKERDNFINELFSKTNLKLLRFKVNNFYDKEEIEKAIMGL